MGREREREEREERGEKTKLIFASEWGWRGWKIESGDVC